MQALIYNSGPRIEASDGAQWRSLFLAGLVHLLLIAFLWIGIQWQNKESTAVEAEVWDMTVRQAAPTEVPIEQPRQELEVPKQIEQEVDKEDPEIALERERARIKAEKKKIVELEIAKKKEQEKLAKEEKKKLAKEQAAKDKIFEENMKRLNNQAVKTNAGSVGDAVKSTGNNRGDAGYLARIGAKVKANTIFSVTDTSSNNPTVEFLITLFPDGTLKGPLKKTKSSGNISFDEAVEKAIEKSVPFPRDKTGEVPPSLIYIHKMKE